MGANAISLPIAKIAANPRAFDFNHCGALVSHHKDDGITDKKVREIKDANAI